MQEERYRDGSRARRELGLPRTPLEISVREACRWFRDHGYLPGGEARRREGPA